MSDVPEGYKQTEVGVIPNDWSVRKLSEIGDTLIGLTYSPRDVDSEGILILRSSNIQNGKLSFDNNVYVKCPVPQNIMVQNGDILICVRNGSRDLIGKSALIDKRAEGMSFGAFMSVFRSQYGFFLANYFKSDIFYKQVHEHLGATINQITNKSLNSFLIALPPLPEQYAIASALADVDALLDSLEELLTKKRQLKQAAMQELLTGETRLDGFEGEWEEKRLGDIAEVISGGTPSTSQANFWGGSISWCTPTDLTATEGKYLDSTERSITAEGLRNSAAALLPVGTILFCSRASIGEVKISSIPTTTNQGFQSLICGNQADNHFLYYLILAERQKFIELAKGSTFLEISSKAVKSITFDMPPLPEQQAIASILSEMDAELEALEERLSKTRDLKQGMMQELLTGRTRLI